MSHNTVPRGKICIALSGGVDSSVAAYLLQQDGYEVIAAFIKVWQPDFLPCSQEEDRVAAKRVAAALGIPFFVVDLSTEYKNGIVKYMVDSYTHGETPNPDVLCNKVIKFGALWTWAQQHGCTYIATGHHAQVRHTETRPLLVRGVDASKDQAYFLWELTTEDLAHILLPIGHMHKRDVRAVAARAGLPSATRADSQGLCFLGALTMGDFLGHLIPPAPGNVYDAAGVIVGIHEGIHNVTRGQRGGFTRTAQTHVPLYVVDIRAEDNALVVAPDTTPWMQTQLDLRAVVARDDLTRTTHAEVRYHGEAIPVHDIEHHDSVATLHLATPVLVSPGQSCVLYTDSVCIGGGIVAH